MLYVIYAVCRLCWVSHITFYAECHYAECRSTVNYGHKKFYLAQMQKMIAQNFTCTRSFMILDLYFKKSTPNFTCTRLQDDFFSVQLWFSVKIQRIRFVGFSVRRIISVEDIIRADVDHPSVNALCRRKKELVKKPILPLRFYGVVFNFNSLV